MVDPDILALEELTLNTSPATHQALCDGWVLRASGNDTRRANSATAIAPGRLDAEAVIDRIEAWYASQGQPAIFRLTEGLSPAGVDDCLAQRGYTREVRTHVMVLSLTDDLARKVDLPAGARIQERELENGLADLHELKHSSAEAEARDLARQSLWRGPQLLASVKTINGLACTGMARIENNHLGLFNLRTAQRARRKGYASMLVSYFLTWGQAEGATRAFLQVDAENAAAVALYRSFGFTTRYDYWHRVAPGGTRH
ncbi:MAG: GNAT family N-acetyltransferase [Betaproteobacteria bacterium]|nr:GNAT family N-acetyltransferase [Betaproteobacteria bacterium]